MNSGSSFDVWEALAALIAAFALVATLLVARSQWWMSRMASYARLHEQLVSADVASGRRALFVHGKICDFPAPSEGPHECDRGAECACLRDDLWNRMNQALAWYDTLGTYVRHGLIPRDVVLRAWYHPLLSIRPHVYAFLDHRAKLGILQPWDALQELLDDTLWYTCDCRTCMEVGRPDAQGHPDSYSCTCDLCKSKSRQRPPMKTVKPEWFRQLELFGEADPSKYAGLL